MKGKGHAYFGLLFIQPSVKSNMLVFFSFVFLSNESGRKPLKRKTAVPSEAHLVGALSHGTKGHGFDSWSGHMPRLWVSSPVGAHTRGNGLMFLSHIDVFLPPSLTLSLSLESKSMFSGED